MLWEDTVLRVEPSPACGKPPELPNLPKRITVDELLQPWFVMSITRTWRKLRRPAAWAIFRERTHRIYSEQELSNRLLPVNRIDREYPIRTRFAVLESSFRYGCLSFFEGLKQTMRICWNFLCKRVARKWRAFR